MISTERSDDLAFTVQYFSLYIHGHSFPIRSLKRKSIRDFADKIAPFGKKFKPYLIFFNLGQVIILLSIQKNGLPADEIGPGIKHGRRPRLDKIRSCC